MAGDPSAPRLLLLLPTTTYQADAFLDAAADLGIAITVASEQPSTFEDAEPSRLITLDLDDPGAAAEGAHAFHETYPISAVLGVDDRTATAAAAIAERLGLGGNTLASAQIAQTKLLQRTWLQQAGLPIPRFQVFSADIDPRFASETMTYPCVLKPVDLAGSRGVIRTDDAASFRAAFARIVAILDAEGDRVSREILVEDYVPGTEYAVEGVLSRDGFYPFAIFDKPDPLEGPFFEETIYVTPSRLDGRMQSRLVETVARAASCIGLTTGAIHAELRVNEEGPWIVEVAARPIGGKCGQVLRFGGKSEYSLEYVLLAFAMGKMAWPPEREAQAAAVMMIPIPRAGTLVEVRGIDRASAVGGVDRVVITAHRGMELVPLPEGSRYLGFIFARGPDPAFVEGAIREAHGELEIVIE